MWCEPCPVVARLKFLQEHHSNLFFLKQYIFQKGTISSNKQFVLSWIVEVLAPCIFELTYQETSI